MNKTSYPHRQVKEKSPLTLFLNKANTPLLSEARTDQAQRFVLRYPWNKACRGSIRYANAATPDATDKDSEDNHDEFLEYYAFYVL